MSLIESRVNTHLGNNSKSAFREDAILKSEVEEHLKIEKKSRGLDT